MVEFTSVFTDSTKLARKIKKSDYLDSGIYPIIDQGQEFVIGYTNDENGLFKDVPAIIFGDHTRIIKYIDKPFFIGADGVKVLKSKLDEIDYKYLFYALRNINIINTGYNRHFKWLKESKFNLPNLKTQREISTTLDSVENIINLKKKQLSAYDQLIKSRFVEMFGTPGKNEKGWRLGSISDIGRCVAGATPSTKVKEYWENGTIPWMSSGEVNKGRIFDTDTKISELGYKNASTKLVPPHTVVLAMAGQGKTRGTVAITEIELCTNQSICSIVNNKKIDSEYLLMYLKMQYEELRNVSNGAEGRGGLNLKIIGNFPIMIPPIEHQIKFASIVKQVDKLKFED